MANAITIPRLGWNMDEGVFAGWLKQDGDFVRAGDRVFTLEGEKATEEIESLDQGILHISPDGPKVGDTVAVGTVIGFLAGAAETPPFSSRDATAQSGSPADVAAMRDAVPPTQTNHIPVVERSARPAISPRARRTARELGVDWEHVQGTGRTGRIREHDIRAAAAASRPRVNPIRKAIADLMLASHHATAPVTLTTSADVSNLVNLRNQFRAVARGADDVVPGYTDFVVKLAAAALERHPVLSASWDDGAIVPATSINIGIAVDTEAGLLVPVIRDVSALGLRMLAARARDLADRARRGALIGAEMRGGVFTVTNLGAFGVDAFTPIINAPESAILGMGRIQRRPVASGDQVVIRDQMVLSLTFDHRIVDGAPAARFLQTLVQLLENPGPWLMP